MYVLIDISNCMYVLIDISNCMYVLIDILWCKLNSLTDLQVKKI